MKRQITHPNNVETLVWTARSDALAGCLAQAGDIEVGGTWGTNNKEAVLEFLESMGADCENWTVNGQ